MTTKNNRDSDRESERPYTPNPPQHMDPSKPPKNEVEKKTSRNPRDEKPRKYPEVEEEAKSKPKRLGESESEIDDETTV
jgi:hypothetical protein